MWPLLQPYYYMKWSVKEIPEVIYCDNHIVVAIKPSGMLTQPDQTQNFSLEEFVKNYVKEKFNKPGAVFLHAVHRLDRPVSGLVLFAKTSKALSRLNEQSREGKIGRIYIAEVEGTLLHKKGVLEHYLLHGEHLATLSTPQHPQAKKAVLAYCVLKEKSHSTVVQIALQTGRYHQIRAQFAATGHPIMGDVRYHSKTGNGKTIHLCSTELTFLHPVAGDKMSFQCTAPF